LFRRTPIRSCIIICAILVVLALVRPHQMTLWDGFWDQEEYRISFVDRMWKPVEGVQLQVENEAGTVFHHFPVTEFLPGHVPASAADGVLVFHHAPLSGVGGRAWWLFVVIPMGEHSGPVYVCRFLHGGHEVHRIRYNDLVNTGRRPGVKRWWKWLTFPELQLQVFQGVNPQKEDLWALPMFDRNGNGRIDRDEGYARHAAEVALERAVEIMDGQKPEWEELEFRLVERLVILDLP
jgi:hypothetical protein